MNRQTYLDAMGISRWRSRDAAPSPWCCAMTLQAWLVSHWLMKYCTY